MNTQNKQFKDSAEFSEILNSSISSGYLDESYKILLEIEYEKTEKLHSSFELTDSGFIAHQDSIIITDCGCVFHSDIESEEYIFDEYDDVYILRSDSVLVLDRRNSQYFTHENNCKTYNDIYWLDCISEYVTLEYLEYNDYVFMNDGSIEHSDDVYYWESDGDYHYQPEPEPEPDSINSYTYKPNAQFHYSKNENRESVFFGIELEIENEKNDVKNKIAAEQITNNLPFTYCKSDGSLNNGFEIVTHPLSFEYIKENSGKIEETLKYLTESGFRSFNTKTCGMHIHISKSNFSTWHLFRFMQFFQQNKDFIIKLSQRELSNLDRWAALSDENRKEIIYKTKCAKKNKDNFSRYSAINLNNSHTIEIRIFRGTLAAGSFFKNIEFCRSLFEFTRDNNEIELSKYKQYVNSKNEFKNLAKFMQLKGI